jgi:hypothetical protein
LCLPLVFIGLAVAHGASADGAEQAIQSACSVASDHAEVLQREGKLREARVDLAECSEPTCPAPIRDDCAKRLVNVDGVLPTIVLAAKDAAGHDVSAVRVVVDGELFADRVDGKPRPIDPGEHHFVFEASGFPAMETTWVIMQGEKDRRERIVFASPEPPPPSVAARPATPAPSSAPALATHAMAGEPSAASGAVPFYKSTWFWGAVGAAALIGGAIYFASSPDTVDNKIHLQMQVPH